MLNTSSDKPYLNLFHNKSKPTQPLNPFLSHHSRQFKSSTLELDSLPIFKKSKVKINLHQLQIEAEDLGQEDQQEIKRQKIIIDSLHQNENFQNDYENKEFPKSAFKRDIKLSSQIKKKLSHEVRLSSSSLFTDGFLPDVKKFYNTFRHLDRQKQKEKLFRSTFNQSDTQKKTFNPLKLAQNIQQNQIFPKKLGMIGRNSCHQLNQNNFHMTKRQMKAFAQGMALMDVRKLGLSNNKLTKQNTKLLLQNVPSKLQKINLKSALKTKDVLSCLNSQKLKSGNLKKLNLSDNRITDTGLLCIEQVLMANANLQILNLSSNLITDQSCQLFGTFIEKNLNLRNLNFSWNQISGKKVFFLFEAMSTSSSLLNVNLSRNKIGSYLNESIPMKMFSKKRIQNELKQKSPSGGFSSLYAVCEFLKKNKYLLHLDISFNSIKAEDCQVIAQAFNVFNESLVGLHFQGNSNYLTNYLGYLIEQPSKQNNSKNIYNNQFKEDKPKNGDKNNKQQRINLQNTENLMKRELFNRIDLNSLDAKQESLIVKEKKNLLKSKHSIYKKPKNTENGSVCKSECWMCHGWITQTFTFQIKKSKLQAFQSFKTQRKSQEENSQITNVYLHLENYDYQPLLMKIHKNPKKAFKNMALGHQKNSKDTKGEIKLKTFRDGDLKEKPLDSMNTITFCEGLSVTTFKNIQSLEEEQIFYNILVKIPANQKIKYFFTIHGEVFLNSEEQKIALDSQKTNIKFETFNPFRKGLNKKLEQLSRKGKGKQNFEELNEKIKLFVGKLPPSMQISLMQRPSSTYSLVLNEVNIYNPQSKAQDTQKIDEDPVKFQTIYNKLIEGTQQLTSQEYESLVQKLALLINEKEQGSQKYISSDKLIEQNQLINSVGVNENQFTFLKPRNKDFFFGHSDPKSSKINLPQSFCLIIFHLDKFLKYENYADLTDLQRIIDNSIKNLSNPNPDSEKQTSESPFYPSNIQLNSKNMYLTICQSAKNYYQNKIKIDKFTGQITKICNFDKEQLEKSEKSLYQDQDGQQNKYFANQASKIKISKVFPYVLIKYSMLKEEDGQNSKDSQDIYERLEETKKNQKAQKNTERKVSRPRISTQKSSPAASEYTINIMKAERKDPATDTNNNRNKQNQNKSNSNGNTILKTQALQLDVNQILSENNISTISMKLVQEILFPSENQNIEQTNDVRTSIEKQQKEKAEAENAFIQKIQNWKAYNHLMDFDFEEKSVLKFVSQQIVSNLQEEIKRSKSVKKILTKKANKFNLKINKFCSLQSNTQTKKQLNFISLIGQKKKPSFNLDSKKVLFESDPNDYFKNISDNQNGFDFDSPLRQSNSKIMDVNKMKRLQDKLNGINIGQEIQVFLQFDGLFDKNFIEFSLNESIDTYIDKINQILNKKNSKSQARVSLTEKKDNVKSKKQNPAISSNQSTFKSLKNDTSKGIFRKPLDEDKPFVINQSKKNINKNIFMFLADEKERQYLYFPSQKTPEFFPFNDTVRQSIKLNIAERILNRFQYINVNLIKNLTKNHLNIVFPSGAKEILLKQLCIYRYFLFNSPTREYKEFANKLIDTVKTDNIKQQSYNPDFITKVKRYTFGKILDLLQEHLLYTIFFLTKHLAFAIFANRYKRSSKRCSSLNKPSEKKIIENLIKDDNPVKVQVKAERKSKEIKNESLNQVTPLRINDLKSLKTKESESLIAYMKKNPLKFGQELKQQMKSIITEILSMITQLHLKYDIDIEKQKESNITRRSSRKNTIRKVERVIEKMDQRARGESLFSQKASKNQSGEKSQSNKNKNTLKLTKSMETSKQNIKLKNKPQKLSLLSKQEVQQ